MGDLESNPNTNKTRSALGTVIFAIIGAGALAFGLFSILLSMIAGNIVQIAEAAGLNVSATTSHLLFLIPGCFLVATGALCITSCTHATTTLINRITAAAVILAPLSTLSYRSLEALDISTLLFRAALCSGMYFPMESDTLRVMRPISIVEPGAPIVSHPVSPMSAHK
jgi:hypothetical protein